MTKQLTLGEYTPYRNAYAVKGWKGFTNPLEAPMYYAAFEANHVNGSLTGKTIEVDFMLNVVAGGALRNIVEDSHA